MRRRPATIDTIMSAGAVGSICYAERSGRRWTDAANNPLGVGLADALGSRRGDYGIVSPKTDKIDACRTAAVICSVHMARLAKQSGENGPPGPMIAGAEPPQGDKPLARVAKYIPGETVAFFLGVKNLIEQAKPEDLDRGLWLNLCFVIALLGTPVYLWWQRDEGQPWIVNTIVATVAFPLWVLALAALCPVEVMPARIRSPSLRATARSPAHTDEPRPNVVSFASRTSSSVSAEASGIWAARAQSARAPSPISPDFIAASSSPVRLVSTSFQSTATQRPGSILRSPSRNLSLPRRR